MNFIDAVISNIWLHISLFIYIVATEKISAFGICKNSYAISKFQLETAPSCIVVHGSYFYEENCLQSKLSLPSGKKIPNALSTPATILWTIDGHTVLLTMCRLFWGNIWWWPWWNMGSRVVLVVVAVLGRNVATPGACVAWRAIFAARIGDVCRSLCVYSADRGTARSSME